MKRAETFVVKMRRVFILAFLIVIAIVMDTFLFLLKKIKKIILFPGG